MVNETRWHQGKEKYSAAGFGAALANGVGIELVTWLLLPWFYLAIILIPVLLLDLAVSVFLATRRGKLREIGWGMLVGSIAGPATLIFFIPLYFLTQGVGLI